MNDRARSRRPGAAARVAIRLLAGTDEARFLAAVAASRRLHRPWAHPPSDPTAFAALVARLDGGTDFAFVVHRVPDGEWVGVINLTGVVRGWFQSGYLGYYAFAGQQGRGLMAEGLRLVVRHAFGRLRLHRLEANIQPGNAASIGLVRACGFSREGYSPRYLKIGGRWRDHERWALVRGQRHTAGAGIGHTCGPIPLEPARP